MNLRRPNFSDLAPALTRLQNNISNLADGTVMVPLPNYLEQLDDGVLIYGVSKILWESHEKTGLSCRQAGKLLGLTMDYYQKHLTIKKHCSLKFLKGFQKHIDSEIFGKIYDLPILEFTAKKKRVILPKFMTPELAYYIAYLQGDGCLTSDGKRVCFADEYIEQINKMNSLTKKLFGITGPIFWKTSKLATKPSPSLEIRSV